jgi:predicted nucleotidyltransferase
VAAILRRQGVSARLYVVGGAAMALAYDAERTTRDLDAVVLTGHGAVIAAAHEVARRHDLPRSWLNEQASAYVPPGDDAGRVVFDAPGLVVLAASPARLFTMKAQAARAPDVEDIRTLAGMLDIRDLDRATRVCDEVMPDQPLTARSRAVLQEVFEQEPDERF